jgi:hypothetical protein
VEYSVDLITGCNEFVEMCTKNGAQRVISAVIERANDLQVELWFCGVK